MSIYRVTFTSEPEWFAYERSGSYRSQEGQAYRQQVYMSLFGQDYGVSLRSKMLMPQSYISCHVTYNKIFFKSMLIFQI